jgi:tRNA (cytidine/uridine-2'-O-)-methyltransferase
VIDVALFEPDIPPNTGNIARLCVATGVPLHLIGRLGFRLDDLSLRRAGLDYWHEVVLHRHTTLADFAAALGGRRIISFSARAAATYTSVHYQVGDCLLFGSETRGLPGEFLQSQGHLAVMIPMPAGKVRSLNLATTVGIALYEALRQLHNW